MSILLSIGQVSNLYGISPDTLRHYDKIGLLKPMVKENSKYRYYTQAHLDLLETILVCRYLEIPLKEIRNTVISENLDSYLKMIQKQETLIEEKIKILTRLQTITTELKATIQYAMEFKNDYQFKTLQEKHQPLRYYSLAGKELLWHAQNGTLDLEESDSDYLRFTIDSVGDVHRDSESVIFCFHDETCPPVEKQLQCLSSVVTKKRYSSIFFWGTYPALVEYLHSLCRETEADPQEILVKFHLSLLHENLNHEYFMELFVFS